MTSAPRLLRVIAAATPLLTLSFLAFAAPEDAKTSPVTPAKTEAPTKEAAPAQEAAPANAVPAPKAEPAPSPVADPAPKTEPVKNKAEASKPSSPAAAKASAKDQPADPAAPGEKKKKKKKDKSKATTGESAKLSAAEIKAAAKPGDEIVEPTTGDDLLSHLDKVIGWQRSIASIRPMANNPRGALIREGLAVNATRVLRLSFDFAKARAVTITVDPSAGEDDAEAKEKLQKREDFATRQAAIDQHILNMQKEIQDLGTEAKTPKLPPERQDAIKARRQALDGQIKIAQAQQELMTTVKSFWTVGENNELNEQIESLARTVPEMQTTTPATKKSTTTRASDAAENNEDNDISGLLGLGREMYAFSRKKVEVEELGRQAELIRKNNDEFVASLKAEFQAIIAKGTQLSDKLGTADDAATQAQMDALLNRFRELSRAVAPLAESNVWLDSSQRNVRAWKRSLDKEFTRDLYQFGWRLGILGIMILVPLVLGEFARRATLRYARDVRRKRQLSIIRRVVVSLAICLVILLSLITEFDSLATFAGFLTAGLAVALQNVILSMVAYFFYFSRYGVRVGNRVTIGTTVGEVVDIGLVRIHLMELDGDHLNAHPTGQIVSFPNFVLLQPVGFFKRLSGTDYAWHDLSVTFAPDTDDDVIEARMQKAVDSVYDDYKEIARPVTALEQMTHSMVATPRPRSSLRYSNEGLIYQLRYPVESERSSTIDYRLARAVLNEAASSPALTIVSSDFAK